MKMGKLFLLILLIMSFPISCTRSSGYFLNGAGEWELNKNWELYEGPQREKTVQKFEIGDTTYRFAPGSYRAIEWIDNRRKVLEQRAIEKGVNVDWYIDRNISEGETW